MKSKQTIHWLELFFLLKVSLKYWCNTADIFSISENYFNVKAMLDKVDMEAFEFTVSADLKMCKLFLEFKVAALEKIYFE